MPPVSFYRGTEFEKAFRDLVGEVLKRQEG
jgi:hypothetical protein